MSKLKPIIVHVVACKNTTDFFDYLRENYRSLAATPEALSFNCYALDAETVEKYQKTSDVALVEPVYLNWRSYRLRTIAEAKIFARMLLKIGQVTLGGSNGHAAGLNAATRHLKSDAFHVIADADTAILMRFWDQKIRDLLKDYDVVGAPYEDIGGFTSGDGPVQTYKKFPNAVWLAFSDRLTLTNINWFPAKEGNIAINTDALCKLYNLPKGRELIRDVGWILPQYIASQGGNSFSFDHIKPSSPNAIALRTGFDYHEEYQIDGVPFVGHHRGSHRHPFRQSDMSNAFFDAVEAYLRGN